MKLNRFNLSILFFTVCFSLSAQKYLDQTAPIMETEFNGQNFTSAKTLAENLEGLEAYSTFAEMLSTDEAKEIFAGNFVGTVFVVSNSGFEKDLAETETNRFASERNQMKLVNYLVVRGRVDRYGIEKALDRKGGRASFATVSGEKLGIRKNGEKIELIDSYGNTAEVVGTNFYHSSGFFHFAEGLVLPANLD